MSDKNLGKSIKEIFDESNRYIIPLYQRNYAWGKDQIEALIQDIYEACKKDTNGRYFIGSLIVLKRHNGDYEVIDGQQRLTTLSLLTKILGITSTPVLFYESRPEVEEFFSQFYSSENNVEKIQNSQTYYLCEAVKHIKEAKVTSVDNKDIPFVAWSDAIKEYLANNVILVKVEIPEDTDVASYFEIMNNRGEQLQKHEILKARLMDALNPQFHNEFDLIWTACSNMDKPIQQCFNVDERSKYFGSNNEEFTFTGLSEQVEKLEETNADLLCSINGIIDKKYISSNKPREEDEGDESSAVTSIIDFPNFLMHIMKLFAKRKFGNEGNEKLDKQYPLNEKFMLDCALKLFGKNMDAQEAEDFIVLLFKCRTLFDRFVVKIKGGDSDEEFSWVLNKPQVYVYANEKKSVKYNLFTFGDTLLQRRIIKAQSMFQVTYRQRIYKNWLQVLLTSLVEQKGKLSEIDGTQILKILHNFMKERYEKLEIHFEEKCQDGVNTPHFLLNFIDYLYWVEKFVNNKKNLAIEEFDFRYWNSVEHHMAVNWARRKYADMSEDNVKAMVDCLGNLFLISKNANSRLSDRDVKEKVSMTKERNMGANRQIIYNTTRNNNYDWTEQDIENHYEELLGLINNRETILL